MSDGWGHDTFDDFADGFDEGFGRGPEGFSDFQEDWGATDAFWESEGDGAGPDTKAAYDEGWNDREDAFDDEWQASAGGDPWGVEGMSREDQEAFAEEIVAAVHEEHSDRVAVNQEFNVGRYEEIGDDFDGDIWHEAADEAESIDAEWQAFPDDPGGVGAVPDEPVPSDEGDSGPLPGDGDDAAPDRQDEDEEYKDKRV